ncbi:MAG: hypothetical protein LBC40_07215 [Dysgonamonadaceae bacterium]|jgi:predicted DNA-binding protein YlxM (UPF0122 family)|nr:hypothetical protein [Dysgonamonadaceae bacterium]
METLLHVDITYEQILSLVKQLPRQQKIKLSKELEKEYISEILTKLLTVFHAEELSLETIDREVEIVRQQIYDRQKHESHI